MTQNVPDQVRKQVSQIWEADLALQLMLALLILTLFLLVPLAGMGLVDGNGGAGAVDGIAERPQ